MHWYGALQEGPTGVYTILVTNFANGILGGKIADDRPDHVAQFLEAVDRLIANGDRITLVTDRFRRLFRPADPPTLWRLLVERYASERHSAVPHGEDEAYYDLAPASDDDYFGAQVCIALVQPGAFLAMHRYLAGARALGDTVQCARAGCRAATERALLLVLRANTHVPSSQDVFHTLVDGDGDDFAGYVAGPDHWATVRDANSVRGPDVAEFGLQYAETMAQYRDLGDWIAQVFAVLHSCERYRLGLKAGGRFSRELMWLPLPLELPDVPENLVQGWMG